MQLRNLAVLPIVISLVFLSACKVSNHEKHSEIQQSALKGKRDMSNLNLMLNEVFKTHITDISSQRTDVSHIVSQYIHSGTHRHEINNFISNDFDILENSRDLYISLFFDGNGNLLSNSSYLDKSNNL